MRSTLQLLNTRAIQPVRISIVPRSAYGITNSSSRPFSSALPLRLKEDAQRSPEEVEKVKQEQLKKQEQGKGEWHEELASQSESHVAADRQNVKDHDEHIEELQKETAGQKEKEHPHGKDGQ